MGLLNRIFGGGNQQGQGMGAQLISQLTTDLNLTAAQLEKIKSAFQQFREQRKGAKAAGEDMKSRMHDIKQGLKSQIQDILTPEQKQKFMQNMEKYKDFFQGKD
jgi:Spy/CpxP family protein refolding chaperone